MAKLGRRRRGRSKRRFQVRKRRIMQKSMSRAKRVLRVGLFGQSKTVKLRYVQTISLNANTSGNADASHIKFSCNSLFDPDQTGGGHQPMGYDQICTWFTSYQAISARISVTYVPVTEMFTIPAMVGITLDNDATFVGKNMNSILEEGKVKPRQRMFVGAPASINAGKTRTISQAVSLPRFYHVPRKAWRAYENTVANCGASPAEQTYFVVWCVANPLAPVVDPPAYQFQVMIEYVCTFFDPLDVVAS